MAKYNMLKLPYQVDVTVDFIHPLVLRVKNGRVEAVQPMLNMYEWVSKIGVLVYNADDVDIAFLLVSPISGRRRIYNIYVSARIDTDVYASIVKLVELLWVGYERSYSGVVETLVGKNIKELRKTLLAYIPPDA